MLGRSLAAIDALASLLRQHVTQHIQHTGHRSLKLCIEGAHFTPWRPQTAMPQTETDVQIARHTVLQLMAARYGFDFDPAQDEAPAVTCTEERIAAALQTAVRSALEEMLAGAGPVAATAVTQRWQWLASVRVGEHAAQKLCISLGTTHSAQLEQLINRQRPPLRPGKHKPEPLRIDLRALLLEKTVTAADIQQLHVGSVLPIHLERARVALNGQAMLTASVAEHQGKLHLTAFETLE